jgi:hypothetical protein
MMNTNMSGMSPAGNAMFQMMVAKLNGDMRFVGIFNIVYGAILCLSIIGAIVGVPLIIGGIRLREAADSFEVYLRSSDFAALEKGLERQGRFFFILWEACGLSKMATKLSDMSYSRWATAWNITAAMLSSMRFTFAKAIAAEASGRKR